MKDQVSENFTWYRSDLQWDDFISEKLLKALWNKEWRIIY